MNRKIGVQGVFLGAFVRITQENNRVNYFRNNYFVFFSRHVFTHKSVFFSCYSSFQIFLDILALHMNDEFPQVSAESQKAISVISKMENLPSPVIPMIK